MHWMNHNYPKIGKNLNNNNIKPIKQNMNVVMHNETDNLDL